MQDGLEVKVEQNKVGWGRAGGGIRGRSGEVEWGRTKWGGAGQEVE